MNFIKAIKLNNKKKRGFTTLIATMIILCVVLVIVLGLSLATFVESKISRNFILSSKAFYAAEAGIEDSVYRIIKGKQYQATNSLLLEDSTVTVNISGSNNQKTILVNAEKNNRFRNLEVKLGISNLGISFYYGVQVGEGGLTMGNNSKVAGSVYSNGDIQGGAGALISGDAWVAGVSGVLDQQSVLNNADFIFGKQADQIDAAQSFTPSITERLTKISLYLKKVGNPGDKTVRILTDNSGNPSKNLVGAGATGTLISSQISQSSYGWIDVTINSPPLLQAGNKYWIVVDTSADNNDYFYWGEDSSDSYAQGTGKYSSNWNAASPNWFSVGGDLAFKSWMGGEVNFLDLVEIGGNAHAHRIANCSTTGDAYYQEIINTTVGGTLYPGSDDPSMEPMPVSESNIADWKAGAETGGVINNDYILINGAVDSLGPKKIIGDLIVDNGADLTITGTIYVTGNIAVSNNAIIRLGNNYGEASGTVLSDSLISITNNAVFFSNGAGTYIMFLSTKSGNAINVSNNASTVIFYASAGNVTIANNAIVKEVTAYQLTLSNNAQVIYETGLASAKFSTGSGAGWVVQSWKEVP